MQSVPITTNVVSSNYTQARSSETTIYDKVQGRIQDFKLGGGAHLKKLHRAEGGTNNFWGISCEKSRFYAKKSYFFYLRRVARKFLGYFM